ncbi:MAG: hypothetical protein LBQ66_06035 [Planctomycetaceae bacterium]|jgi:GTPase SAR1 family protein|nr:hypothetical protein [Planctomycetaceae bacterium]
MKPPQIALIGTEGSGKTVLATVMAKRLSEAQDGIFLNPIGAKTALYIEKCWNTLQSGEWVPSTPPGQLFALKWNLSIQGKEYPTRLIDSAGQDLRKLFFDEGYNDPNISEQDKQFIQYLKDSNILILIVNLKDFIGESDPTRRMENQIVVKEVLDVLKRDKIDRQLAIIFTQYDLYKTTIERGWNSCEEFIKKMLPYLHSAHIHGHSVKIFPVAAVNKTEVKVNAATGKPYRVPAHNFTSDGLEQLIRWLKEVVPECERNQAKGGSPILQPATNATVVEKVNVLISDTLQTIINVPRRKLVFNALITTVFLFVIGLVIGGIIIRNIAFAPSAPSAPPLPISITFDYDYLGFGEHKFAKITNTGNQTLHCKAEVRATTAKKQWQFTIYPGNMLKFGRLEIDWRFERGEIITIQCEGYKTTSWTVQ